MTKNKAAALYIVKVLDGKGFELPPMPQCAAEAEAEVLRNVLMYKDVRIEEAAA